MTRMYDEATNQEGTETKVVGFLLLGSVVLMIITSSMLVGTNNLQNDFEEGESVVVDFKRSTLCSYFKAGSFLCKLLDLPWSFMEDAEAQEANIASSISNYDDSVCLPSGSACLLQDPDDRCCGVCQPYAAILGTCIESSRA
ncbi:hypothetical protein Mapa_007463 [Marchantia paleacea]|nr:hypothetical protein Mapa_007463 [Marchantia paleacea]